MESQQVEELLAAANREVGLPGAATDEGTVFVTRLLTPLGPMLAGASSTGICLLEFMDRRMLKTQLRRIRQRFHSQLKTGCSEYFDLLDMQLQEYFFGLPEGVYSADGHAGHGISDPRVDCPAVHTLW